jgi:hypothetical protein
MKDRKDQQLRPILDCLQDCFLGNHVLYTRHARNEMRQEEFGPIHEREVFEAVRSGKVIENYPDDEPYPSILVYGRTITGRPIHVVCAYADADDLAIVITVYEPDPARWLDFERRKL